MDIKREIGEVLKSYPLLAYDKDKNELKGELYITNSDSYELRIELTPYPRFFPNVYEVNERIPNKPDRHIYTNTGSFCFTTTAKSQVFLGTKIKTLTLFIKEIVVPYLQNNSYYEIKRKYKTDEYSHDSSGVIEGYRDILQIDDDLKIAQIIVRRIEGEKLKIHYPCYCGSRLTMKKCFSGKHDLAYRNFKKIEKEVLYSDLENHFSPYLKAQGIIKQ